MALATRTPRSPAPRIGRADAAPPAPADQPNVTDALTRAVILEAHDLTKTYPLGQTTVDALRGVSLAVVAFPRLVHVRNTAGRRPERPGGRRPPLRVKELLGDGR